MKINYLNFPHNKVCAQIFYFTSSGLYEWKLLSPIAYFSLWKEDAMPLISMFY